MRGVNTADFVIIALLAALAAVAGGGNPPAGLLLLLFIGGLYASVRLTRGRLWWVRVLAVSLVFALPLGIGVLLFGR